VVYLGDQVDGALVFNLVLRVKARAVDITITQNIPSLASQGFQI